MRRRAVGPHPMVRSEQEAAEMRRGAAGPAVDPA